MLTEPKDATIVLSSGSVFEKNFDCEPYNPYPVPSTTSIIFTDTSGIVIGTITGTVTPDTAAYLIQPAEVDAIPAGANFEVFVTTPNGPYKIRYGKVIRRQVTYPNAPTQQVNAQALVYTPSLQFTGNALSAEWVPIDGTTVLHQNTGEPNSMAVDVAGILGFGLNVKSAVRYWTPLNTDSWRFELQLLASGTGKLHFIFGADSFFTSFMSVDFDGAANTIGIGIGSGPYTVTEEVTPVGHTVANLEQFVVTYDDESHTVDVYLEPGASPILTWSDSSGLVPHGPGYRYFGASWVSPEVILHSGPQICAIGGQDSV